MLNRPVFLSALLGVIVAITLYFMPVNLSGASVFNELIYIIPSWTAYEVSTGGPAMIFILMALESASLPIPSEVILPLSGFLIAQGKMEPLPVMAAATSGSLVGSLVDYYVGYIIGMEALYKKSWISSNSLKRATLWFNRYGEWAVVFSRMLAGARTLISFPAGAFRMDVKKFTLYTLAGSALWCGLLIYIGMMLGSHWSLVINAINKAILPAGIGFIAALFFYFIYIFVRKSS